MNSFTPTAQSFGLSQHKRYHWIHGTLIEEIAEIVEETPWTIILNGREFVTLVATPTDLKDLVIGFLASEGVIQQPQEISIFHMEPEDQQIWVRIPHVPSDIVNQFGRRYLGSCCGKGRPGFYFVNDQQTQTIASPPDKPLVRVPQIFSWYQALSQWTALQHSGGLHAAGLVLTTGHVIFRSDVGRHNALDKLYGHGLQQNLSLSDSIITFSGRLSSEIILKVAKMQVPVIISNAAPTDLGIELAHSLGVTIIGFVRDDEFSIYTHPHRVYETHKSPENSLRNMMLPDNLGERQR